MERHRLLNHQNDCPGAVVCWLSRDQRCADNWALLNAQQAAINRKQPLWVVFCLQKEFLGASPRNFAFMLSGLQLLQTELEKLNIPLAILEGNPAQVLPPFCRRVSAGLVVCDFSPLRVVRQWKESLAAKLDLPLVEVDAHNIIPCWLASDHQEYGAYTLRPKINRQLTAWLTEIPPIIRHPFKPDAALGSLVQGDKETSLKILLAAQAQTGGPDRRLAMPGVAAANRQLDLFLSERLVRYPQRNDPNQKACSGLSPWLHFGHLAPHRVALAVKAAGAAEAGIEPSPIAEFLEELIVRRELSDNYCYYNPAYDQLAGFPAWARQTLRQHQADPRPYRYSETELEAGETHDRLWNAAQHALLRTGSMPGYLRMYWAKKILEWTIDAETAQHVAIRLNDRYSLDGRDPNGYTGIAWSIGGVHDRAWGERPVFGKIRTMTFASCRRKFDVEKYIQSVAVLDIPDFGG